LAIVFAQKVRKIKHLSVEIEALKSDAASTRANHLVSMENINSIFGEFALRLNAAGLRRTPHLGLFVSHTKAIFDTISTSGQCAVSIKLLVEGHSRSDIRGPYIWTAKRD